MKTLNCAAIVAAATMGLAGMQSASASELAASPTASEVGTAFQDFDLESAKSGPSNIEVRIKIVIKASPDENVIPDASSGFVF